jgi:diacylglycerol kinase family enzyme
MTSGRRVALVVNPAATKVRGGLQERVHAVLEASGLTVEVATTTAQGDGARIGAELRGSGVDAVVTLGGDGVVNEVLGALLDSGLPVATMPGGNANVFARATGWPRGGSDAIEALGAIMAAPEPRVLRMWRLRVGGVERLIALNAGMGIDGETVERIETHPELKRRFRHAAFLAAGMAAARSVERRKPRILVSVDGGPEQEFRTLLLAAGWPYSYIGGRPVDLLPSVDFAGEIAWSGLLEIDVKTIAKVTGGILLGAKRLSRSGASSGTARGRITATSDQPIAVQADGEFLGTHDRIEIEPAGDVVVLTPPLKFRGPEPKLMPGNTPARDGKEADNREQPTTRPEG